MCYNVTLIRKFLNAPLTKERMFIVLFLAARTNSTLKMERSNNGAVRAHHHQMIPTMIAGIWIQKRPNRSMIDWHDRDHFINHKNQQAKRAKKACIQMQMANYRIVVRSQR